MPNPGKGRGVRTRGVNEHKLKSNERAEHTEASVAGVRQSAPTEEGVRRYIEAQMCPFCGSGPWKLLPSHTNRAHGIDRRELRAMAGLSMNQPVSSPETIERMRRLAIERDIGHSPQAQQALKRANGRARPLTEAGKKRMSEARSAAAARLTPEERAESARRASLAVPKESRRRQGEWLRAQKLANPATPVEVAAFKERMKSPEVEAKRAAAREPKLRPHGTRASYRRGCRCEECRSAYLAYRKEHG